MTFLIDEDSALWTKLQGFSVQNYADGQQIPVQVYYRFPDDELITRKFPHFAIDLIDVHPDTEREARAFMPIYPYNTESATPASGITMVGTDLPLPWMLEYQVAAFSRTPWHDRQLGGLLYGLFPRTFGFLDMTTWDGTIRRADLWGTTRRDRLDTANKRMYCQIFTIGVSSEFTVEQLTFVQEVSAVNITQQFTGQTLVLP